MFKVFLEAQFHFHLKNYKSSNKKLIKASYILLLKLGVLRSLRRQDPHWSALCTQELKPQHLRMPGSPDKYVEDTPM